MANQTLLWTALPRGRDGQTLLLSAYLSPRLTSSQDTTLAEFPDFVEWPQRINGARFSLEFDGVPEPIPAAAENLPIREDLWQALFNEKTEVRGHVFRDYTPRVFRSYPVRDVLSYIEDLYRTVAEQSPTEFPKLLDGAGPNLSGLIEDLGLLRVAPKERDSEKFEKDLSGSKIISQTRLEGFSSRIHQVFYQAGRFYWRPETQDDHSKPRIPLPKLDVPRIDFHMMVATLANYPDLLRAFGLVIDLRATVPSGVEISPQATVRVLPDFGGSIPAGDHRPQKTHYQLHDTSFRAVPRADSDLEQGFLKLDDTNRFDFFQVDVDGAALKVFDFAGNLFRMLNQAPTSYQTPDSASLPALRSGGFSVARYDRAKKVYERLDLARTHNQAIELNDPLAPAEFHADDLVRGYRIDVHDGQAWRSLCERSGTYRFPDSVIADLPVSDREGYVKGASASTPEKPGGDIYLHECLFGWDGWSLCAPPPGRSSVQERSDDTQQEHVRRVENAAATPFKLEAHLRAIVNTLPRLRYGRNYRLRARLVDLAGNGEPPDSAESTLATEPKPYLRFEPVPSPALVLRAPVTEGESLETLVIRSNDGISAADYVELDPVRPFGYAATNSRHVVPPKTSQVMAELHGCFDTYIGPGKDHKAGFNLAVKEAGTLLDIEVVDWKTGQKVPVTDIFRFTPPDQVSPITEPIPRGKGLEGGEYIIHAGKTLAVPYLPDPMAQGVAFRGMPGAAPGTSELVSFEGDWPDREPFRVVIQEGDAPPDSKMEPGVLHVFLPKATITKVRYSSYPVPGGLDLMGIWHWLSDTAKAHQNEAAMQGRLWSLTPYRELTLVHAVQQPLEVPFFGDLSPKKDLGATYATFGGYIGNHSRSTGKIDVEAWWTEPVDLLTEEGPRDDKVQSHVAEFDLHYDEVHVSLGSGSTFRPMRHEFGDTRYRVVEYYAVATTRYREFFPPEITREPANITVSGRDAGVDANAPAAGKRVRVAIYNSARPAAPKLLYVVPTFEWSHQDLPQGGFTSMRAGGGLRVYLDRPWYSSGDGELLGVVFCNGLTMGSIPEELKPYVTQWGKDPLWRSRDTKFTVKETDFKLASVWRSGLSIDELQPRNGEPAPLVSVAGHQPAYDRDRKLWYCDIKIDTGNSYFPFVRLALARYQPNSVNDAHLSRVVLADFAQLAPNRTATLSFSTQQRVKITVSGIPGFNTLTESPSLAPDNPNSVKPNLKASRILKARLERPGAGGGDLDWLPVAEISLNPIGFSDQSWIMAWQGALALPSVPKRLGGTQVYRVVIEEFEVLESDPDTKEFEQTYRNKLTGLTMTYRLRQRPVYVDVLEI